jgi:hypothetical protein
MPKKKQIRRGRLSVPYIRIILFKVKNKSKSNITVMLHFCKKFCFVLRAHGYLGPIHTAQALKGISRCCDFAKRFLTPQTLKVT